MRPNRSPRSASSSCWARAEEIPKMSVKARMRYRQPTSETLHEVPTAVTPRSDVGGIVVLSPRQIKSAGCRECRLMAQPGPSAPSGTRSTHRRIADVRGRVSGFAHMGEGAAREPIQRHAEKRTSDSRRRRCQDRCCRGHQPILRVCRAWRVLMVSNLFISGLPRPRRRVHPAPRQKRPR